MNNRTIAIAGLGWLGQPLALRLATLGYEVKGSVSSLKKAAQLQQKGINAFPVEISENGIEGEVQVLLRDADYLIILIPPGLRRNTGADHVMKMMNLLQEVRKSDIKKIILVSSTSVYDDSQGEVTENDAPKPDTIAGKQLRQVEELFIHSSGFKTSVVRFGGLIGGSRQPVRYLAGRKDLADAHAPVNLIHRKDCIEIIVEILKQDAFGHVFNAVNPDHPKKSDYYIQKAKDLSLEPPHFLEPNPEEIFKQIDSINLKNILGYEFGEKGRIW